MAQQWVNVTVNHALITRKRCRRYVRLDIDLFAAYTEGFLENLKDDFSASEIMLLPEGAKMMTIECGMRFLADYLQGDTYFKTHYPDQNLDRCRTQFKLDYDMEQKEQQMKEIIKKYI